MIRDLSKNRFTLDDLSDDEIRALLDNLDSLSRQEMETLVPVLSEMAERVDRSSAQMDLLTFCHRVYPGFKEGPQHRILARKLEALARGEITRLVVSMPPRHGKSELCSYLFVAWFMGHFPKDKLMMATHTADLSKGFGRKTRDLIESHDFQRIFPDVRISKDSKAADLWHTMQGGEAFYSGVGASLAGRGADLYIIDDPHNEQDALSGNPAAFDGAYEWYTVGPVQRLMPGGRILIIHTRWSKRDLIGRVLDHAMKNPDAPQWEVVELPAILPSGRALWEEQWPLELLNPIKSTIPKHRWMSQYQQQPMSAEEGIIKATDFRSWTKPQPPRIEYTIISLDSAIEAKQRSDFSVFGVWGVWVANPHQVKQDDEEPDYQLMPLDVIRDRMEYPELKKRALSLCEEWRPDCFVIEKKASGQQLLQELRRMRLPVVAFEPGTQDKMARLNSVSDMVQTGLVWVPAGYRWAEEFVAEVCEFPAGAHDDCVDMMVMALDRFRRGGFYRTPTLEDAEQEEFVAPRRAYYRPGVSTA